MQKRSGEEAGGESGEGRRQGGEGGEGRSEEGGGGHEKEEEEEEKGRAEPATSDFDASQSLRGYLLEAFWKPRGSS